jgi:phosphoribosyl 1,2-cyclic phosphate phosphodiesterase
MPLYASPDTAEILRRVFQYVFDDDYKFGGIAKVDLREITGEFALFDLRVLPVPVIHGEATIFGYRIGRFAYVTDFSHIPAASLAMLHGVELLILDGLRHRPHPTHSTVEQSLQIAATIGARETYLTHICHDLAHEATERSLPAGVHLAYDGLQLDIDLES